MNWFTCIGHALASFVSGHKPLLKAAITDAQTAANATAQVAGIFGDASVAEEAKKIAAGLQLVSTAVDNDADARTLNDHAAILTDLTTQLVSSGDLNVKSAVTQAAVINMASKVQHAVGVIDAAVTAPETQALTAG